MERKHAIIVIKDDNDKFLQYFDDAWNSYLFLNVKLTDENDYNKIINDVNQKYNIDIKDINLVMDKIHTKFSCSDKIMKEYHHFFYSVTLEKEISPNNIFKYFSYDELLKSKRIMEVNSDIVSFIKEGNL